MDLDRQESKYKMLDRWFESPQGAGVAKALCFELQSVREYFDGKRLVQLGSFGQNAWLNVLPFRQQWIVTPYAYPEHGHLIASLSALPLERNSVDCVVAPLCLEAFGSLKNPLDEIDRILKPMGYVVFFGFNPMSFWGAALRFHRLKSLESQSFSLVSSLILKRAMVSRGYSQCLLRSFYYIPPVKSEACIHHLRFLNEMGKMIWPFPAGFYCFIVQKYQPASPNFMFASTQSELLALARN